MTPHELNSGSSRFNILAAPSLLGCESSCSLLQELLKEQTANDLNKVREAYNAILEKGKEFRLDEAVYAGQKRTHMTLNLLTPDARGSGLVQSIVASQASITNMRILRCCLQSRRPPMSPPP